MIGTIGERDSRKSMLSARFDDYDAVLKMDRQSFISHAVLNLNNCQTAGKIKSTQLD